jgi:hypothetical protein
MKQGERKPEGWLGPYFIQVIKGGIRVQKDAITVLLYEIAEGKDEHRKEYITINNIDKIDPDLFNNVPKLRAFIEDNLGFYVLAQSSVVAYLAMYALKPEPALPPEPEVIEDVPDHEFDFLVAKA